MNIGVIGLGTRMAHMVESLREHEPHVAVCGVVDPDEAGSRARLPEPDRDRIRYFPTMAALVEKAKPDALAIGTRCNLHARLAVEAADFGLPLFLEKPVATTLEDALALEEAFSGKEIPVLVSFPLRASPLFRQVLDLVEKGAVGRPLHLLGWNYVPYGDVYFASWYRDYHVTQGLFLQKATHDLDYLLALAASPVVRVAAMRSQDGVYRDARFASEHDPLVYYHEAVGTPEEGMNEDSSSVLVEFANGGHGVYTQVFYSRGGAAARGARISGMAGTVEFDWYRNEIQTMSHSEDHTETLRPEGGEAHFGGDRVLAQNFIEMVRGSAHPITPLAAGLESVFTCLAAKESAETGRFVPVHRLRAGYGNPARQTAPSEPENNPL